MRALCGARGAAHGAVDAALSRLRAARPPRAKLRRAAPATPGARRQRAGTRTRANAHATHPLSRRAGSVSTRGCDGTFAPRSAQAAGTGDARCLEVLLAADATVVNARVKDEGTAVHIACEKGHSAALRLLLRHGADVEAHVAPVDDPRTPLHLAAEYAHEEVSTPRSPHPPPPHACRARPSPPRGVSSSRRR
eukprot:5501179-Prymnesium_polylepis.1